MEKASLDSNPPDLDATMTKHADTVVVDVEGYFARVSTATSIATHEHCSVKPITNAINVQHGLLQLRELITTMLERHHIGNIWGAAFDSNMTPNEILQHLVWDFEIALDVYQGEKTMSLNFPEGITIIRELILSKASVEAVVQEWLQPIIALAKQQCQALNGRPTAHQGNRRVVMTGFWATPKCIVHLFNAAIEGDNPKGFVLQPVHTIDNADFATLGALWSMTADGKGRWEIGN
ncbi:hypothetical protein H2200_004651 [Cladophialophora chaetospira]|uniref:Uncharacterized protein n=1 Tax=Cladophialophora chaetospira TaxID=386627 RepID=A0AA38XEA6_9EURO|nr:hypothetical protein H2200_004651 [Cladophialophora chaetospira]